MRTLKSLSRRSLALLLTLVMMTGMVNLSAFAADEPQQDWDESFPLPNPQEVAMQIEALNQEIEELDPEAADYEAQLAQLQEQLATLEMLQYPMEDSALLAMDGRGYENFGQLLLAVHPKNGVSAPVEGGVWSAEGQWEEDGSDVLTMSEDGRAVINEPKGPAGRVTVKYTYTHEVEITTPAADTAPKADAAPEVAAPVEGEGDKAEAPADGEQKAEGAEPQEPSEPAEGDQEQDAADVNPDEENSGEEPAPEIAPDQEEDAEGAGEAENNGEEPAPEVVPAEDNTAEDQGEADAEIPENAENAPETSEGKNGEEGDEGEDGVQPESSEPAEEEPAEDPSEEVPATTTQQVEETLTWTVVFTSEVEPLAGNKITQWSQLKTGGDYVLDADLTATGSCEIISNTTVDLNGHTISYGTAFKGNLFNVTSGTLTIKDNAGTGKIQGTDNNTGSLVLVNGGTFNLQGGTLTGNRKGAAPSTALVWENNGSTSAPKAASPIYFAGAGVFVQSGTFSMSNGSITGNSTIGTDGYKNVNYLMYKELRNAYRGKDQTRYEHPLGQGGGVYVADNGTFNFTGGNISSNQAGEGGGIFVKGGKFTMSGSAVVGGEGAGNIAHLGEGGGIYIQSSNEGNKISGGKITYNETHTTEDLGGGGIYVENSAYLKLVNARITANDAYGLGGGVAACVHGQIALVTIDGAAIYQNTASGKGFVKSSSMNAQTKGDTVTADEKTWYDFIDSAAQWLDSTALGSTAMDENDNDSRSKFRASATDLFSAGDATQSNDKPAGALIGNVMIGKGLAKWSGWRNSKKGAKFTEVKSSNNAAVSSKNLLALKATPDPTDIDKAIAATGVLISNNKSTKTHGGGVATNGMLAMGEKSATEINNTHLTFTATKTLNGRTMNKGEFTFELLNEQKQPIAEAVNGAPNSNGSATVKFAFPDGTFDNAPKATDKDHNKVTPYTFYIQEKDPKAAGVTYDRTLYQVTVEVTAKKVVQKLGENTYTVDTLTVGKPKFTKVSGSSNLDSNGKPVFNNEQHYGSLKLVKAFEQGSVEPDGNKEFNFKVTITGLPNGAYNGVQFTNGVANVKVSQNAPITITGIPSGLTYQVEETDVDNSGYTKVTTDVIEGQIPQEGEPAVATITNKRDLADLTVTKTVSPVAPSSQSAPDSSFAITVKLGDGTGKQVSATATEEGATAAYEKNGVYNLTVKNGHKVTITGIPTGTTYTVEEAEIAGFNRTDNNTSGTVEKDATVAVVNHYFKMQTVDKSVTKVWSNPKTVIPGEAIIVQLQQDGKDFNYPVLLSQKWHVTGPIEDLLKLNVKELNETNAEANNSDWTYSWTGLDKYVSETDATEHVYSIKELHVSYGLEGYEARQDENAETIFRVYRTVEDQYVDNTVENPVKEEILGGWVANINEEILENKWIPADELGNTSLAVKKVDYDSGEPISEVTFTLTKTKEGNVKDETTTPREQTTNDQGIAKFEGLTDGEYLLKEEAVHEGYRDDPDAINASREWTVTVVKDKLTKVEAINEKTSAHPEGSLGKNTWSWKPQTRVEVEEGKYETFDGEITIKNQIIKGQIKIDKTLILDGVIEEVPGESGEFGNLTENFFHFGIYRVEKDSNGDSLPVPENAEPIQILDVKGDGKTAVTSKLLPYGTYLLRETVTTELPDYIHAGTEFNIYDEDGYPYSEINEIEIFIGEQGKIHEIHAANHYTHDTGSLSVGKTVVGVPTDEAFQFEVKLTLPKAYVAAGMAPTVKIMEGDKEIKAEEPFEYELDGLVATGTVEVAHGQKAVIEGIPTHAKYEVKELNRGKYEETHGEENANKGTIEITEANAEANYKVSFTNTQWIGTSVSLGVRKILSYQDIENMSMVNRQFTFELFQLEEDNGSVKETKVGELKLGGSEFNLAPAGSFKLDYSHELNGLGNGQSQTFVYEIREVETAGQGYIWAPRMGFQVKVRVENGQYYAEIVDNDGNALTNVDFNNKINVFQGDKGKIQLGGLKNLNGSPSDRAFDFTLTDVTDPENPVLLETVQNAVSAEDRGVFKFAEIELSAAGMTAEKYQVKNAAGDVESYQYKYEIREVSEGAGNLHIDRTVYTVIVDVKDIDGVMQVQKYAYIPVDAEGVEGEKVESDKPETIVFNNILTPPPPTDPPTTPDRPTTPPDEPVPDPEVPLTPGPEPEPTPEEPTPEVEIPGDDVPLAPAPEIPEEVVFDEDVPLAAMPPEEEIFDGDVPLANVPKTGDATGLWAALTALSGASLAALGLTKKRKGEDDEQA